MKWRLAAAGVVFLAGAIAAQPQTAAWAVKVRVPFSFEVVSKKVPAGDYVLFSREDQVYLREANGNYVAVVQSNHINRNGGSSGQVVFRCYQDRCFLSQLWLPDAEQGHILLESKAEKEAARKATPQQFALLGEAGGGRKQGR